MQDESGVIRRIIDELHSCAILRDQMECESGVIRSILDELPCCDMQGDQMGGSSGVTVSIIDDFHSWDIQGDQIEEESMVIHGVLLMNFILQISKEMKWKAKTCCYSKFHRFT